MKNIDKVPKNLGAHRQAAIALFRALLSQCSLLPIDPGSIHALKNIIRQRFRLARPQRIRLGLAFQSGYTALDILDASVAGSADATKRVLDLLARTPNKLKTTPLSRQVFFKNEREAKKNPAHADPPPEKRFEAVFPREKVEGVRKVPFMVNANGLPFIRWKKPQPKNVSRTIWMKLRTQQRQLDQVQAIAALHWPLADREDEWDGMMKRLGAEYEETRGRWAEAVEGYEKELSDKWRADKKRDRERVERFTKIIWRERELAEKERVERKALKLEKRTESLAERVKSELSEKSALSEWNAV
ncbi:hypothetical protein BT63DRAFT_457408 [Microthyrium microscopicum]|uniref:Uncharacterized protein n=1 Tax=Microthyrium microscopicum TaxID=703497 RepID=A0A6A6U917_9PEZI|nr:hypothetical protein BT63DRAFT_457408 [Microthyrium microscopicum]